MKTKVIDGSKNTSYIQQQKIVAELAKTALVPYEIPTTLEAVACIFAEYFRSKKCLFNDDPATYTCCQENIQGDQAVVGRFIRRAGLGVVRNCFGDEDIGVAALRRF